MKKEFFLIVIAISLFSIACKKSNNKDSLRKMSEIQNLQSESIIGNSEFYVNIKYFRSDSFQIWNKEKYDNYIVLYRTVCNFNSYIVKTKAKVIEEIEINYFNVSDSLNILKNIIVNEQSKISSWIKDDYEKNIERLQINENIEIDENDGILFNLLYLSSIQAKYSLMLSSYSAFEFSY